MFWHNLRSGARRTTSSTIVLGIGLALAGGGGTAQAGTDSFCERNVASNEICSGPTHTLTASRGWNLTSGTGCGGALKDSLFYCATPAGCHAYNGLTLRTPGIRHRSITAKSMKGYSTWGSTGEPSYCDPGTPYGVAGPISAAANDLAGVPALAERRKEQAPAAVAKLWPTADASAARRFSTPRGDGWILVVAADRKVCIAVADAGNGYGYGCQSYGNARTIGSLTTLEDADATKGTGDLAIGVVADGSKGLKVTKRDGTSRTLVPVAGVVVTELGSADTDIALDAGDEAAVRAQRWSVGRR